MSQKKIYLAVDLGAGSGRVLAAEFDGSQIQLHELNRFANTPVELDSGMHWNIEELFQHILEGLKTAHERYGDQVVSIGIDTWGVDYGLLDSEGKLLKQPYHYRNSRTAGMMEAAYEKVPAKEIYEKTGIQFLPFNTIYQLQAEISQESSIIDQAEDLLFIPDLLAYWLTGKKVQERSAVSTSQLYNPKTRDWDQSLIEQLGFPKKLFKQISDPGDIIGPLTPEISEKTGLKDCNVVVVAGHDTGSAVAAFPSQADIPAYLSSGTWSLIGLELPEPMITEQSFADGFTNEIGVDNTVRFLKNICGLWLIQESKRYWAEQGKDIPYSEMASLAMEAAPFRSFIDPDDARFAEAGKMPEKIQEFCRETDQPVPETDGEIIRCIYESLAISYANTWKKLTAYLDHTPEILHIGGGGAQDKLLNQFAANAIGITVHAGPIEATGLGNIMTQMRADGLVASLKEGRQLIKNSSEIEIFEPTDSSDWQEAIEKCSQIGKNAPIK